MDSRALNWLGGALSRSYLPKERAGKPSEWVTLYAMLAQAHRQARQLRMGR